MSKYPVNGQCKVKNVIYEAKLMSRNGPKIYTGMTGRQLITRIKEHKGNFKHSHQKGTKLSSYAHKQLEFGEDIKFEDIKWSIKAKAVPYKAGAKFCDLCLSEKTLIALSNPTNSINSRTEIVSKCIHKRNFKLKFFKRSDSKTQSGGLHQNF